MIIEKTEASYHGFTLFAERTPQWDCYPTRGWNVRVLNRQGNLLQDDIQALWKTCSEAQDRGFTLVKNEMTRLSEKAGIDDPRWFATN